MARPLRYAVPINVKVEVGDALRIENRARERGMTKSQVLRGMIKYALKVLDDEAERSGKGN
jgi:hypothetical protein